jgi:hypothetical protein
VREGCLRVTFEGDAQGLGGCDVLEGRFAAYPPVRGEFVRGDERSGSGFGPKW